MSNNNTLKSVSEYHNFIGIDISKSDFVVAIFGNNKTIIYNNNKAGWEKFYEDNISLLSSSLVVLEVTGGHEMGLLLYLQERSIAVHRADTRKVKNYVRSYGKLGKTDKIDALLLAQYGHERQDGLSLFIANDDNQEKLKLLQERKNDLVKILVQEKNRAQGPSAKPLAKSYNKMIKAISEEITLIESEIAKIIDNDDNYKQKQAILREIAGIGDKTANMLLSLLPELGKIDRKQIASLVGLAPHPKQSGSKTYYASATGGRRSLRPLLFMAAMAASRSKSSLGEFYSSLIARGKKAIIAQVAVMRKIIVIANARIRDFEINNQRAKAIKI